METTTMGYIGLIGYILGLYWGYIWMMEDKMETTISGLGFRSFWKFQAPGK